MCKSELNACFTKVLDPLNANSPITHGCLHPIANVADICSSSLKATNALTGTSASTLDCCNDDMCNYRGLHDLAHTRDSTGKDVPLAGLNHSLSGCFFTTTEIWNSLLIGFKIIRLFGGLYNSLYRTSSFLCFLASRASVWFLIGSSTVPGKAGGSQFTLSTWREIRCIIFFFCTYHVIFPVSKNVPCRMNIPWQVCTVDRNTIF